MVSLCWIVMAEAEKYRPSFQLLSYDLKLALNHFPRPELNRPTVILIESVRSRVVAGANNSWLYLKSEMSR